MSLRWRSELLLELRMRGCQAQLLGAGWTAHSQASASAGGSGGAALSAALAALRLADVDTLPSIARLRVADEYVLHRLIEGEGSRAMVLAQARALFDQALGPGERHVMLLPLGRKRHRWLASAINTSDLAAWTDALSQSGVYLADMQPMLFDEWQRLRGQIRDQDAVLVLLRDEGATLIRLIDGLPVDLLWERFDPGDAATLDRRLRAFARTPQGRSLRPVWAQSDHADTAPPPTESTQVIYLLPESKTLCRYVWDRDAVDLAGDRAADAGAATP